MGESWPLGRTTGEGRWTVSPGLPTNRLYIPTARGSLPASERIHLHRSGSIQPTRTRPSMRPLSRILVPALALAAACAPAATGSDPAGGADPAAAPRSENRRVDLNVISQQEIAGSQVGNAFDLVRARRPRWLSAGSASPAGGSVIVYVNKTRMGGPETLRSMAVSGVGSMRYYDPTSANIEFGHGHLGGVIQVTPVTSTGASRP